MKITHIVAQTVPLRSDIRNSLVSFAEMTGTIVRIESDVVRSGRPVAGLGFGSIGRYASTAIVNDRLVPRLMAAAPADYVDSTGANIDAVRAWPIMMRNEKPGGHGERSTAVGAVDMALWDLAAKIADMPLWRLLSDRFNGGKFDDSISVYAAGGYYHAGGLDALRAEVAGHMAAGYGGVKMKIGGAPLAEDLVRIDAAIAGAGAGGRVAVDANGRFDIATAKAYAAELAPRGVKWFEEAGDPLDFALQAELSAAFPNLPYATGENLFSHQDVRNLVRHAGMNPARDTLQMDPALAYGLPEYLRMLDVLHAAGWSPRRCVPHGGHQFSLHLAAGLQLGGNEAYPGVFQPFGGFADDSVVSNGTVRLPDAPGIGIELKANLRALFDS
ncbi:MAG TPA: enolase C-terminal domain-like protein [Opitutaceae bacterium]